MYDVQHLFLNFRNIL